MYVVSMLSKRFKYLDAGVSKSITVSGTTHNLLRLIGEVEGLTTDQIVQALAYKHVNSLKDN